MQAMVIREMDELWQIYNLKCWTAIKKLVDLCIAMYCMLSKNAVIVTEPICFKHIIYMYKCFYKD